MDDLLALYGTAEPPQPARRLRAGHLSVDLVNGNLRTVRFGEREVLRAIAYVVRDRDWGTYDPAVERLEVEEEAKRFQVRYEASCRSPDGAGLRLRAAIEGTAAGALRFAVEALPDAEFETNRCGFCVLHPIEGVAGSPVEVLHVDGSLERSRFPDLIEPWQPFRDMRAIAHAVADGLRATCRLEGDTFEMEDQRAWTDASYKTYVRPLALPWPYRLPAGETNRQSVELTLEGPLPAAVAAEPAGGNAVRIEAGSGTGEAMPRFGVVVAPEDAAETLARLADLEELAPRFVLFHFDPGAGHGEAALARFARIAEALPEAERVLEFAVPTGGNLDAVFGALREGTTAAGLRFGTLVAGADVDRQSTPPGSRWPDCPPAEAIHAAARRAFPEALLGGGMLSYFTELNRKRVPLDGLDFVTHATCPIVHVADDLSVMQTLEAIPFVTRSARALMGTKSYRLGPTTIAMRQNPYGSRTMPNPDGRRVAMADDDPRARGLFGAAFLVGYAARLAGAGVEAWCGSSFAGPRGLFGRDGRPTPLFAAARDLGRASGCERLPLRSSNAARVDVLGWRGADGTAEIRIANLTDRPQAVRLPNPGEGGEVLELGPYEIAGRSGPRGAAADQAP